MKRKVVALFCDSKEIDPVAPQILALCRQLFPLRTSGITVGGKSAEVAELGADATLWCVPTETVASYIYPAIAKDLNQHFGDADAILVVNWHMGANAPSKIFCAHATSDVAQGIFGPTSSRFLSTLLHVTEHTRKANGLDDWRVIPEASHWSGTMMGRPAQELLDVQVPVYDFEIGSYPDDFANQTAQLVVAQALGAIVTAPLSDAPPVLFVGGIHFEPSACETLFHSTSPTALGHILPNQWLVSGEYQSPGAENRIVTAAKSDKDAPQALVFHDGLKGAYKECVRNAAAILNVPTLSHRKLRDPNYRQLLALSSMTGALANAS